MDVFTFAATALLSFVGIVVGTILAHYTRDEVHSVKQYIPFFQFMLLIVLFIILYFFFPFYAITTILVVSMAFIYFFWHKNNLNFLDYIVISMLFVISSLSLQAHLFITIVAFIFGIFSGALFYVMHTKHKKHKKKHIAHHKHSGLDLHVDAITTKLFHAYKFFFILALLAFAAAHLLDLLLTF